MKSSVQRKTAIPLVLITLALASVGLLPPNAFGVVPPPDGGYPGANTAEGQNALLSLTTGGFNTASGWLSLRGLTTGSFNTSVGAGTLALNNADENTATGSSALQINDGDGNTANGVQALANNADGDFNTADGNGALLSNTTGTGNTAIGASALQNSISGDNNVAVGAGAGFGVHTASNVVAIGAVGADVNNSCYIANIFGATSASGLAVFVNSDGKLGTITSSRRFKQEIQPIEQASEALFSLNPVTFRYRKDIDPAGTSQFGLVAEDVEKINPDLIVRDKEGKPYSVRYDQVNAMLLNEFLKEHRKVENLETTVAELKSDRAHQETTISDLKSEMHALMAQLREQAAQIQEVSTQVGLGKAPPQVVVK